MPEINFRVNNYFLVVSTFIKEDEDLHLSPCSVNCSVFYAMAVSCIFVDSHIKYSFWSQNESCYMSFSGVYSRILRVQDV